MKTKIIAAIILLAQFIIAQPEFKFVQPDPKNPVMTYKGHYTGKSVFLKNQFPTKGPGFCIHEVRINGKLTTADISSELIEVVLDHPDLKLKTGDEVSVEIKYIVENMPRIAPTILTPGALLNDENFKNNKEDHFVVEGKFYGGELYVTNYFNAASKTHSIKQITVNGKPFNTKLDRDIVAINLYSIAAQTTDAGKVIPGLNEGDAVKIELVCEKGANPVFLNLDLITPLSN